MCIRDRDWMDQITYEWEGERVDTWLVKQFSCSRSFFHHILARNWVLVNNKPVKKSFKLKSWDKVIIDHFQRYLDWEILEETPNIDLPIVKETDDYLTVSYTHLDVYKRQFLDRLHDVYKSPLSPRSNSISFTYISSNEHDTIWFSSSHLKKL